jgi:hypothetical protein
MLLYSETDVGGTGQVDQWYKRATTGCAPFLYPESRFRTPWTGDDLPESVAVARRWHAENPCPDEAWDQHLTAILDAYAEMSVATVARVMELREVIHHHVKAFDRQKGAQRLRALAS